MLLDIAHAHYSVGIATENEEKKKIAINKVKSRLSQ